MSKEELIEKAKAGRVEFGGNVAIDGNWTGDGFEPTYAHYADKDGIHAWGENEDLYGVEFEPFGFDEVKDEVFEKLANDIIG